MDIAKIKDSPQRIWTSISNLDSSFSIPTLPEQCIIKPNRACKGGPHLKHVMLKIKALLSPAFKSKN